MDPAYKPDAMERKILFGLTLEQQRNNAVIGKNLFCNIVSENKLVSFNNNDISVYNIIIITLE